MGLRGAKKPNIRLATNGAKQSEDSKLITSDTRGHFYKNG